MGKANLETHAYKLSIIKQHHITHIHNANTEDMHNERTHTHWNRLLFCKHLGNVKKKKHYLNLH